VFRSTTLENGHRPAAVGRKEMCGGGGERKRERQPWRLMRGRSQMGIVVSSTKMMKGIK